MKEMHVVSAQIDYFKGIEHLTVYFGRNKTIVTGANEVGKTTLYDAFCYCLTGKNSKGETTFGIKPNFLSEMVSPNVALECVIDGKPVNLKRVYQAKFARDKTFKKYQTECFINELPKTVSDFEKYIAENVADNELFKLLTNPKYFTEQITLKKGETVTMRQRSMLYEMAEVAGDEKIIESNPKFDSLKEELVRYDNVSEYKKYLKSTIARVKSEVDDFPVRINQQALNFVEIDFSEKEVREKLETLTAELEAANKALYDLASNVTVKELQNDINGVQGKLQSLERENIECIRKQERDNAESKLKATEDLRNRLAEFQDKQRKEESKYETTKNELDFKIRSFEKAVESLNYFVERLRKDYKVQSTERKVLTACPTCHREYPAEQIEEYKHKFEEEKKEILSKIQVEAERKKAQIESFEKQIEECKNQLSNLKFTDYSATITEIKEEISNFKFEPAEISDMPEYFKRKSTLNAIVEDLRAKQKEFEECSLKEQDALKEQIRGIESEIKSCEEQLHKVSANADCQKKIDALEKERAEANEKLDNLQMNLDLADEFIKLKCSLATEKVNSMFEFTKWKLFDFTQEGNIVEVCVPLFNGTEYKDLSASTKIMCGLDIIKGFQKHYDVLLPIFIDEKETITESIELPCQFVTLSAVEENCPKCGGETGRKQGNGLWKCKDCGHQFKKELRIVQVIRRNSNE